MSKVINIALAEDHDLVRQGLVALINLEEDLHISFEAANGRDVLVNMSKYSPDVLLLDIEMPLMDGIEVLDILRTQFPEVKIIVLSMHNDRDLIAECINKGAKGFLPKNCDFDKLAMVVRAVYRHGIYLDDHIAIAITSDTKEYYESDEQPLMLTDREIEIIRLICKGMKNREIADELFLSQRTIENHRRRIFNRAGIKHTAELILYAIKKGIINVDDI